MSAVGSLNVVHQEVTEKRGEGGNKRREEIRIKRCLLESDMGEAGGNTQFRQINSQ